MTNPQPAPSGATYKPDIHPSRLSSVHFSPLGPLRPLRPLESTSVTPTQRASSRSDVAPGGARRVLFDPSYKDSAPTEHEPAVEMSNSTNKQKLTNRGLNSWAGSVGAAYL